MSTTTFSKDPTYINGIAVLEDFLGFDKKKYNSFRIELKEVKNVAYEARNELNILKNDHINKYEHMTEKFDTLCESVRDLTKEIKELNKELNKKKD